MVRPLTPLVMGALLTVLCLALGMRIEAGLWMSRRLIFQHLS